MIFIYIQWSMYIAVYLALLTLFSWALTWQIAEKADWYFSGIALALSCVVAKWLINACCVGSWEASCERMGSWHGPAILGAQTSAKQPQISANLSRWCMEKCVGSSPSNGSPTSESRVLEIRELELHLEPDEVDETKKMKPARILKDCIARQLDENEIRQMHKKVWNRKVGITATHHQVEVIIRNLRATRGWRIGSCYLHPDAFEYFAQL